MTHDTNFKVKQHNKINLNQKHPPPHPPMADIANYLSYSCKAINCHDDIPFILPWKTDRRGYLCWSYRLRPCSNLSLSLSLFEWVSCQNTWPSGFASNLFEVKRRGREWRWEWLCKRKNCFKCLSLWCQRRVEDGMRRVENEIRVLIYGLYSGAMLPEHLSSYCMGVLP